MLGELFRDIRDNYSDFRDTGDCKVSKNAEMHGVDRIYEVDTGLVRFGVRIMTPK